ncbi:SagB/ThcOx family dehydrogenase [Acidihalobacter yilgarnensis]|uniref:SagB/ThcOx family dehydrogenase n=1 Tax=Acidihalobacter yilgarnensis TaxID=2819280 RepID=UPI000A9BCFBA|nr:SagB/ThcOx family dehydrogenase [Acidihalobacter yilgarnensis]
MTASSDRVLAYHQRTKHHFQRYAPGPAGLDWDTQPDPFRSFAGAPLRELPLLGDAPLPTYTDLYRPGALSARTPGIPALAALLELAFGLSAWKRYGDTRWALRCNPSSGNLHPTEAYVVTSGWPGLADGVHHYLSRDHLLEQRCIFADGIQPLPPGTFLLGLSSIHWREAWKYGERAYRYCQHDIGHALAAARYAAATLGWHVHLLAGWSDADIAALLGIDRDADFGTAEREHPDLLLSVSLTESLHVAPETSLAAAQTGHWQGRANRLSETHGIDWPMIDQVAAACAKPRTAHQPWQPPPLPELPPAPARSVRPN